MISVKWDLVQGAANANEDWGTVVLGIAFLAFWTFVIWRITR